MPRYPRLSPAHAGLSSQVYTGLLARARKSGHEVFALNVGDTYLEPPECATVSGLARTRLKGMHGYTEVRGEPALLDAIERDLARRGRAVARDQLQVTMGGTSGLDLASRTLLAKGDEVILLAPYWPLIRGIFSAASATVVELPVYTELRRPGFDLEAALEAVVSPRSAALYVNSPNNPTGLVLSADEVDVLARFAARHDLWVLSDEAYERLSYVEPRPPVWQHPALCERAIAMHTFSKSYGLAGARVAYLHGPARAMDAIRDLQTFATYCAPRPMQLAASRALDEAEGERFILDAQTRYREAAARVAHCLGIPVVESGTFVFFDTRPFRRSGESAQALLERVADAGVVLTPGAAAGAAYADWARLCFSSVEPSALERALATLGRVLYT